MSTRGERWRPIEEAVFRTITSEDWRRALAEARARPNRLRGQIRAKILDLKVESKPVGKNDHE